MAQNIQALKQQLDLYTGPVLAQMLKARGAYNRQTAKGALIEALVKDIVDAKNTRATFDKLQPEPKMLLRVLREQGGNCTVDELKVANNALGIGHFDANLGELMRHAFVLFSTPGNVRHELWRAPDGRYSHWHLDGQYGIAGVETALELADDSIELPAPTHDLEAYSQEPYSIAEQPPTALLHVLWSIVRWAGEREITLTKTAGTLRKTDLKALENQLKEQSDLKGFGMALAFQTGLLKQKREKIMAAPDAHVFFSRPPREQIEKLAQAWLELLGWSEFFRIPEIETESQIVPQPATRRWGYASNDIPTTQALPSARAYLIGILKRVGKRTLGQWQSLASLQNLIKTENPEFLIPRENQHNYHGSQRNEGAYVGFWPAGENRWKSAFARGTDWDKVEGRFVRQMLSDPLNWLGMVAIGRDKNGAVVAFRLTPLGAHLLGLSNDIPDLGEHNAGEKPLIVQPNFEIIAYSEPQHLQTLYQLERFATRERADRVAHYKLDRESVYRGLQDGMNATQMREFLENYSRSGVPQNIAYSLDDWQSQWERITIRPAASLIETDTPVEMDAIIETLSASVIQRLAPTWAVIETGGLETARRYVAATKNARALDYRIEVEQAFTVNENLEIVAPLGNVDLWLRSKLEQFADELPASKTAARYEITRESVEKARTLGLGADKILAFLEVTGTPPIPPDVTLTVRGWSGEVAPVSLGSVQVLVADPEVLAQMASVKELRGLLWLRAGEGSALVKTADVPKLKAALKKRGIAFDGVAENHLKTPQSVKAARTQPRRRAANRSIDIDSGLGAVIRPFVVAAHPDEDDIELQIVLSESALEVMLEDAIKQSVCVVIEYQSKVRKAIRKISPMEVFGDGGNIYVGAWDHWRKAGRVFRLDRILRIAVTDEKFDTSRIE